MIPSIAVLVYSRTPFDTIQYSGNDGVGVLHTCNRFAVSRRSTPTMENLTIQDIHTIHWRESKIIDVILTLKNFKIPRFYTQFWVLLQTRLIRHIHRHYTSCIIRTVPWRPVLRQTREWSKLITHHINFNRHESHIMYGFMMWQLA